MFRTPVKEGRAKERGFLSITDMKEESTLMTHHPPDKMNEE